jgi:hypothetical protein
MRESDAQMLRAPALARQQGMLLLDSSVRIYRQKSASAVGEKTGPEKTHNGTIQYDADRDIDTQCGYGSWKPACLQKCNNTKTALLVLSIFAVIQGEQAFRMSHHT